MFDDKLGHFTINEFFNLSNKHPSLPEKKPRKNSLLSKKKVLLDQLMESFLPNFVFFV
jgi:hypothetical protein